MKSTLSLFLSLFFFSGCATSSLTVEAEKGLVLEHENQTLIMPSEMYEKSLLRFERLDITQVKLQNANKERLFFETLKANHDYEFKYSTVETLKRIFHLSRSHTLYQASNLLLIQLQSKDGSYINILAETSGIQELSYAYGYSNAAFIALAQELGVVLETPEENIAAFTEPQTQWSQSEMFLNPLVQHIFRRGFAF
ncbi:MAG: hypothetical protein PHU40_02665 [Sulfurimonas sp.]|nr:hypothetical protein [Sulfurimonas sp.]